ncbi:TPA: GNAT family N-acetyltransferase [Legionella pneumophila]|uniref:GNAT family N-acetyltransferase n=1 Tax=Legionella pneumophila TaxID=446 RepID=UPI00077097F5|nr:GNAT family N-acetyltransferase [Legionella pneumophila]CZL18345.1 Bifunctional AAC/APH [Legionella pneumophila]
MKLLYFCIFLIIFLWLFDKVCLWLERKGWLYYKNHKPQSGLLGTALQELNAQLVPSQRHVVVAKQEKHCEHKKENNKGSSAMNQFEFRPLSLEDLEKLYLWFQEPTIHNNYARGKKWSLTAIEEKYKPRILGKEHVPSFIVYLDNVPFGFIQYYLLNEFLPEGIEGFDNSLFQQYNSKDLVGIDLFIAEEKGRSRGLGVDLIGQFIDEFLTEFKSIIVDPNISNQQAIRCYEKAGFKKTDLSQDPNYLIMLLSNS